MRRGVRVDQLNRSLGPRPTGRTRWAPWAAASGRTGDARRSLRTGRTGRASWAGRSRRAGGTGRTRRSSQSGRTRRAPRTRRPCRSSSDGSASGSHGHAGRTGRSRGTFRTGRPSESGRARRPGGADDVHVRRTRMTRQLLPLTGVVPVVGERGVAERPLPFVNVTVTVGVEGRQLGGTGPRTRGSASRHGQRQGERHERSSDRVHVESPSHRDRYGAGRV